MDRDRELDELLREARQLLGEPSEQPEALRAQDVQIDYEKFYGQTPQAEPVCENRPLTAYEQSRPAYQTARRELYEKQREQERQERQQTQPEEPDGEPDEAVPETPEKPRRRPPLALLIAAALVLLAALAVLLLPKQPVSAEPFGERIDGCSTVLIAGTDKGGFRTDTMLLLRFSRKERSVQLVSLPRDTLIYCPYSVPKLNSAYGYAGGGQEGMRELMKRVREIIGFLPDGYAVVDLDTFVQLVDLMGGVEFDVPMEMHYEDPSQELYIDLQAGLQLLSGEQAMQLVRFRSGYPAADLDRVRVQRDFAAAACSQWISVRGLLHLPQALKLLSERAVSDMSRRNFLWLAQSALLCREKTDSATLPGTAQTIAGGSYYVLDAQRVAQTVNDFVNPYRKKVTAADLSIRSGG